MTFEPGRAMMTGSAARQMAPSMNPASSMISKSMAQPRICFWLAGTDRICEPLDSMTLPLVSSVTLAASSADEASIEISDRSRWAAVSPAEMMRMTAPGWLNAWCSAMTANSRDLPACRPAHSTR